MKTLEQILNYEKEHRVEDGDFGINACKESIREEIGNSKFCIMVDESRDESKKE